MENDRSSDNDTSQSSSERRKEIQGVKNIREESPQHQTISIIAPSRNADKSTFASFEPNLAPPKDPSVTKKTTQLQENEIKPRKIEIDDPKRSGTQSEHGTIPHSGPREQYGVAPASYLTDPRQELDMLRHRRPDLQISEYADEIGPPSQRRYRVEYRSGNLYSASQWTERKSDAKIEATKAFLQELRRIGVVKF